MILIINLMKKLMQGSAKLTPNLIVNLPAEAEKNKACDDDFTREVQKIFSMVNNITMKVNNIEEACRNEFSRINVVIKNLQNETNQHYAVVQRSDFDQQSVSNESEANSTNESETNLRDSSTNSSPSSSSGSSNLSGIFDITGDIKIRFKQHFDRLMKVRNYTFDEMCFLVVVDIRSLGGNIKISTVKNFYNGVSGNKVSTINQINAWVASFNNNVE
ncbi:hypothetical protein GLOIN_2v1598369 [Rhizophagus irregularis DAOM 181602=DAOM 197198]|uniref:Uncharacterized protein n=2 Tax=Rhizophagus irregularis TaxID=588596 RepID=A0A2P4Q3E0_RHIID|nr:hypothetical protein GLOIN_2v1598369 [Rhizophagus irregularis DAOM 181602=DAOM 197198]POG72128.1 hypothetical protein GLOIN_2v1598369 [Rhizophagus irregularis DAOM 181602=DAOM 197198]|eukprot:XP_025178994.1 hypothetical protein GLOIN_2v1598369 [Rhizophagus irregularis DAOM 181602=DAOM 197198]